MRPSDNTSAAVISVEVFHYFQNCGLQGTSLWVEQPIALQGPPAAEVQAIPAPETEEIELCAE